jgi:putative phage-type endonuclease
MKTHSLIQGSAEWLHYRSSHFNASDAPAMMGCSAYKTRNQLLHEMHTGLSAEVDAATQRRFDDGHRFEALARPLAEKIIDAELYPVTGSEGRLSASFDGLTMDEAICFEHKSLNDELRSVMVEGGTGANLALMYRVQMEQQLMISGADKCLFMASKWQGETLVEERHTWYTPWPLTCLQQKPHRWPLAAHLKRCPPCVSKSPAW